MTEQEARQLLDNKPRFFYGYVVVVAATSITAVIHTVHYAFGVFFKPMLNEFGWTRAVTSGAFSISWLVQGLLAIAMGGLNDRVGPRVVLTISAFILGLGYVLMSQITTVWQLYLYYAVILGIGLSGTVIPLISTVARWFTKKRNAMTGIVMAGVGTGAFIGPPVANQLILIYDWRLSYIILGSIISVVVVTAAQFLRRDPTKLRQVPYGESEVEEQGLEVEVEGFSLMESIYTWQFWVVFCLFFCFGFCQMPIMVHIVPHATDLGISTTNAANIMAAIGAMSIIGKVVMGNVADRIGNRQVYIICFILMAVAYFWLVLSREVWMFYLFAVIFGLAYAGCSISISPLVAMMFGIRSHGLILGFVHNGFTIGATIGPIVAGYIFDVTDSYHLAFLLCGAVGILGLIFTLVLRPVRRWGGGKRGLAENI